MPVPISQDYTVIIPTRNRPASAFGLLKYLREQLGWECCIVVVDQSDDHGEELASLVKAANLREM
jgi:glycosyltransferase involved in cell wall biosynthesis